MDRFERARRVGALLLERKWWLATAESCTAGLLSGAITDVPGSSRYFLGGIVAYDNRVKETLLGVPRAILEHFGAVSEPTALLMARGVADHLGADVGVGITGIAGPTGGTPEKPVGLVYIGVVLPGLTRVFRHQFQGDREAVRNQTVDTALTHLLEMLEEVLR